MKHTIFPNTEKIDFSKKLRIKFGIDPTSDKLHLGHLIPLLHVKKLWEQGHIVDIVLGTFTARLGDPSGKDTMRPMLSSENTEKNAQSIIEQVSRVFGDIDSTNPGFNRINIHRNAEWFSKISAIELADILSNFTTTQLLARDSFQKRMEVKNPIGMHELIVPILQGFDSVKLQSDVEIGGNDQMFNFGISRDMQRIYGQNPEVCMLLPIINGTDGRKMSKSFDNCIFLNDTPVDVFGKTMSISDELMHEWFPLFFEVSIAKHMNPMVLKKKLAFEVTKQIWSIEDAEKAILHFEDVIQNRNKPKEFINISSDNLISTIIEVRKCSISEAKRLISQGGIKVNDNKIVDETFSLKTGDIVKVGKLDFVKII